MFLPVKAHEKEIFDGQYKLRLGNRVPKDAVNLAYTHVPAINSEENILITDLSMTILENSKNRNPSDLFMYADTSLMLQTENGQVDLPTEDVLVTNIFKDGVPLYYAYQLTYRHYDKVGPDPYGVYERSGITIIDRYGNPVNRPYQIQLIPDKDHVNLYYVIVYTSFKDKESDTYQVLYNAIDVDEDGTIHTMSGYREPLNLKRAFNRVYDIQTILDLVKNKQIFPVYYQANSERAGFTRIFVPTPRIKDTRHYEKFRYQIGLEVETKDGREVFTTPWYSDSVLRYEDLNQQEKTTYINGFKQITELTAENIMKKFVPLKYFSGGNSEQKMFKRYFVIIDNPNVQESLRVDGSSPIFVKTTRDAGNEQLYIPKVARTTKVPIKQSTSVHFKIRPLKSQDNESAYISFVIDNSESMAVNDPEKVLRYQMLESLIDSARDYYEGRNFINGWYFNKFPKEIRTKFEVGDQTFIKLYEENSTIDADITEPIPALDEAIKSLETIPDHKITIEGIQNITKHSYNHKYIVLITDGQFEEMNELRQRIAQAKQKNIHLCVVTYNNYEIIEPMCRAYKTLCINANSSSLIMELRYFFFKLAGLLFGQTIGTSIPFEMSPDDNDLTLATIDKDSFLYPIAVNNNEFRYGIQVELDDNPDVKEISLYIEDAITNKVELTKSSLYVIPLDDLKKGRIFQIKVHSEAWQYYFSHIYAVRINDKKVIRVLPPREKNVLMSWYPIIQNGRFDRTLYNQEKQPTYHYSIPEYYKQDFIPEKGHPYRRVKNERPVVLTHNQLRVRYTPLTVEFDGEKATNIQVRVNGKPIRVIKWSAFEGILILDGAVTQNDEIFVDYEYEEQYYTYRGFYDKESGKFWHLDLNPTAGHYITIRDEASGEIKEVPSFTLINRTVYIYMLPSSKVETDSSGNILPASEVESSTLFHTFQRISNPKAILLAEIRVRPNSSKENIIIKDTRTRGGGLKTSITPEIMREIEEESFYYWDIGYYDGQPYPENGVIAIRLTRSVLKEYGGRFTKAEIEDKLNKYLGYGILPIIEYVDDPEHLLQIPDGLVAEVFDVDDIGDLQILKPTFTLEMGETDGKKN